MSNHSREPAGEVHLKEYLRLLLKHRWLILAVFVTVAVTGAGWTLSPPPIYQAAAPGRMQPGLPKALNMQEVTSTSQGSLEYYRTQYALMTSRPVLQNAIDALTREHDTAALAALGAGTDPRIKQAGALSVEPVRNTQLVQVTFQHPDPALAAKVATTVAPAHVKYNLDPKPKRAPHA